RARIKDPTFAPCRPVVVPSARFIQRPFLRPFRRSLAPPVDLTSHKLPRPKARGTKRARVEKINLYRCLTMYSLHLSNIAGLPYSCHGLAPLRPHSKTTVRPIALVQKSCAASLWQQGNTPGPAFGSVAVGSEPVPAGTHLLHTSRHKGDYI